MLLHSHDLSTIEYLQFHDHKHSCHNSQLISKIQWYEIIPYKVKYSNLYWCNICNSFIHIIVTNLKGLVQCFIDSIVYLLICMKTLEYLIAIILKVCYAVCKVDDHKTREGTKTEWVMILTK